MMLLLLLACGTDPVDTGADTVEDPLSWSVMESGRYQVGYRLVEQTYTDPAGETVTIPVSLWYPTEDTSGFSPMYYGIQEDEDAIEGATPAAPAYAGGYPVLLFSHGSFLYGGSSSYLVRHFASHGWVVAAPDHIGNTLADYGSGVPLSVFYQRPLNDQAALAALMAQEDLNAATDAVMMAGYSFGSFDAWVLGGAPLQRAAFEAECKDGTFSDCTEAQLAAFETDLSDARVVGIMPLAGAGHFHRFEEGGLEGLSVPALMMSGTEDDDEPQRMWDESAGTAMTWVSVEGGCHALFSVGGCPSIETQEGYNIIEAYTLAFARQILLEDDSAEVTDLLSGAALPWTQVSLQSR